MRTPTLLTVLLAVACGAPAPVDQQEQAPVLRFAFNVYTNTPEDNYEIFVMDLDGWKARNLTNTSGVERVYASHKDRICFVSDHDTYHRCYFLYEMDAYCNDLRRVCDHRVQNSWITKRMNGTELLVDPHGIHDTAFFRVHRVGRCSITARCWLVKTSTAF